MRCGAAGADSSMLENRQRHDARYGDGWTRPRSVVATGVVERALAFFRLFLARTIEVYPPLRNRVDCYSMKRMRFDFGASPPPGGTPLAAIRNSVPVASVDEKIQPQPGAQPAPPDPDRALVLLKRLNGLRDSHGRPYASLVRYRGFEPWWFHQQIAFDSFLVPFTQFETLLAHWASADRVELHGAPVALRQLLRLMPRLEHVQIGDPDSPARKAFLRLRGAASWLFYRMVSIVALARTRLAAPDVLVFATDAVDPSARENRWIGGLHQALKCQRIRFLDVLWSAGGASALRNLFVLRRAVIYANAVGPYRMDETPRSPSDNSFDRHDSTAIFLTRLAEDVLIPASKASVRSIRRYARLLRFVRPRGAFFMDDYVHAFELVAACKHGNIPTVALQHGQVGRYTVGLMGYGFSGSRSHAFDRYCAWSGFFADIVKGHSELIPSKSVVVAGISRPSTAPTNHANSANRERPHGKVSVLFLGEQYSQAEQTQEVRPYILSLCNSDEVELFFKPHPLQGESLLPIGLLGSASRILMFDGPLEVGLGQVDVVIASFTSAIFEAILHQKPVILFSTARYDDPHGLAKSGLAMKIPSPADIAEAVVRAAGTRADELARRKQRVWGNGAHDGGKLAILEMQKLRQAAGRQIPAGP